MESFGVWMVCLYRVDSGIEIRATDETVLRNFGGFHAMHFLLPKEMEIRLSFAVDGALYQNSSEVLASNDPLSPIDTLDQATLNNKLSVIEGDNLLPLTALY